MTDPPRGAVWLIENHEVPAGHVVGSVRFAKEFGGLIADIDDLVVKTASRRQGAARAGVDVLLRGCRHRGCRSVHVEVDPANLPANGWYRGLDRDIASAVGVPETPVRAVLQTLADAHAIVHGHDPLPATGARLQFEVDDRMVASEGMVHFLVPAARFSDDIGFT